MALEVAAWNFCVLKLTNETFWNAASWGRIIAGAMAGAALYVGLLWLPISMGMKLLLEAVCTALVVALTFQVDGLRGFWKVLERYWTCGAAWSSMVLLCVKAGGLGKAEAGWKTLAVEGMLLPLGVKLMRKRRERERKPREAILVRGSKSMRVSALIDTGNSLYEPISGRPVCVLDVSALRELFTEEEPYRIVPWHGINEKRGLLKAYCVPELELHLGGPVNRLKNVFVAINPKESAGDTGCLIIQPKILEEGRKRGTKKGAKFIGDAACIGGKTATAVEKVRKCRFAEKWRGSLLHRRK